MKNLIRLSDKDFVEAYCRNLLLNELQLECNNCKVGKNYPCCLSYLGIGPPPLDLDKPECPFPIMKTKPKWDHWIKQITNLNANEARMFIFPRCNNQIWCDEIFCYPKNNGLYIRALTKEFGTIEGIFTLNEGKKFLIKSKYSP